MAYDAARSNPSKAVRADVAHKPQSRAEAHAVRPSAADTRAHFAAPIGFTQKHRDDLLGFCITLGPGECATRLRTDKTVILNLIAGKSKLSTEVLALHYWPALSA